MAGTKKYIKMLTALYKEIGFEVPLFNADWAIRMFMNAGKVENSMSAANFGKNPVKNFRRLARISRGMPQMCGEFWCGWFNAWGDRKWNSTNTAQQVADVKWMLDNDKSFNLYMFHGGTNFGFIAGANQNPFKPYTPFLTSYDYDAPLSEGGIPTDKYYQFRKLLTTGQPQGLLFPDPPAPLPVIEIPEIELSSSIELVKNMKYLTTVSKPMSMEKFDITNGLILYRTKLGKTGGGKLCIKGPARYGLCICRQ